MGRHFQDIQTFYDLVDKLMRKLEGEPAVRDGLCASDLVLSFRYRDFPGGELKMDLRGDRLAWSFGEEAAAGPAPDVEFLLDTDTANEFFNGTLVVPLALATRKIVAKGSIPKALKLLPVIKPAFPLYREFLREVGREDLLTGAAARTGAGPRGRRSRPSGPWGLLADRIGELPVPGMGLFEELGKAAAQVLAPPRTVSSGPVAPLGPCLPVRAPDVAPATTEFVPRDLPRDDAARLKVAMLRRMLLIRGFEEHLAAAFDAGELRTAAIHLSIGQEAVAVGAGFALDAADWINTTHRGHGHILAKDTPADRVMAEIYGREAGVCRGRGGSMHVIDVSRGVMGSNGIVGAGPLLANGAAWTARLQETGQVSVVFFGDGATNQGMFHEACNFAAVFKLPVILICENNQYGEFTAFADHCAVETVAERGAAYGLPAARVDGNDVWAVYRATQRARERARAGEGPTLLECLTYRWHGHMEDDPGGYRSDAEIAEWKARCPIQHLAVDLAADGVLDADALAALRDEVAAEVAAAVRFAVDAPDPAPSEALTEIYAPEPAEVVEGTIPAAVTGEPLAASTAIHQAIAEEMERDEAVVLLGEDVRLGGYFGVTQGLVDRFGPERILDTPISEYAIGGAAVGAAATGLRPIAEILFSDFLTTCADPVINQAAKLRYMSGGQNRVPLVVRTPAGGYVGMAAQHSQAFETLLAGLPGLIVCAPGDAYSMKGVLKSAIRSDNPVLFFEHKLLYAETSPVPAGEFLLPLGKARERRRGNDVTVVGLLYGVTLALAAAERLAGEGVACEVIDPVTLYPLDLPAIVASVRRTGRLVVVEEASACFGFGPRIVSAVCEHAFDALKAPPVRVSALDAPVPYSKPLELAVLPDEDRVVDGIRAALR